MTLGHEQRIEEIEVVQLVVDDPAIGRHVPGAETRIAVHVVRVPVPEVLDRRVLLLKPPEHLGLVLPVLEEAGPRPPGVGARLDHTAGPHHQRAALYREVPHHPPARLVAVVAVAFLEHTLQGIAGNLDPYRPYVSLRPHSSPPHTMQPSCGGNGIRCSSKFLENGCTARLPHTK